MELYTKLLTVEKDLLSAVCTGPDALDSFHLSWSATQAKINQGINDGLLDDRTIAAAHMTASSVSVLADIFIDLQAKSEAITSSLFAELDDIFARMNISEEESLPPTKNVAHDESLSCPPYIAPAYKWLLKNLHDPYPSSEVKDDIARSSNTALKSTSAWFTSVRKRIGWTTISRKYFFNCRADTVDAAYRCFIEDDCNRVLDPRIAYDFMEMKAVAESLYSSQFKKSHLAEKLDVMVKDMTDEDCVNSKERRFAAAKAHKQRKEVERGSRRIRRLREKEVLEADKLLQVQAEWSYPSPAYSLSSSPEPSAKSDIGDGFRSDGLYSNKRRATPDEFTRDRPAKRHRTHDEFQYGTGIETLPSPHSPSPLSLNSTQSEEMLSPTASLCPVTSTSRKRRLSDSSIQGVPKHPQSSSTGPRLHVVSDPLPLPSTATPASELDSWLRLNFDIPPAVTAGDIDLSTPFDVELFNDWTICQSSPVETFSQCITPRLAVSPQSIQQVEISDPELQSKTPPRFDISFSSTDDSTSFLTDMGNIFSKPLTLTMPLSTELVPPFPSFSFQQREGRCDSDWTEFASCLFSETSTLPNGTGPQPADTIAFSHEHLPFDISLFSLPTPSPAQILAQADETKRVAEKRAKLEQLRAHREAAHKLEEELLST